MRAVSLVKRIDLSFSGNVVRNALTLGDVDNDGCNELVVGNQNGDVTVFKGREIFQTISKLTFISCVAVGDILNQNRNVLVIITADGWCYVYAAPNIPKIDNQKVEVEKCIDELDGQMQSTSISGSFETLPSSDNNSSGTKQGKSDKDKNQLICIHKQRIPANSKCILLGDIDGDGDLEMVLGLTDRVVRSYRWIGNPHKPKLNITDSNLTFEPAEKLLGKFVALNKWECANQIGSITLHHSFDGKSYLLVAQPGGTFMRIRCHLEDSNSQCGMDNSQQSTSTSSLGDSAQGVVDYQKLGISRMRNQNISTEILGDLRSNCSRKVECEKLPSKGRPYALATLDGTIMLVQDEVILWAFAVDHQVFALTKLDITQNGSDDIVVCCWDGQTYILDQDKNSVRFYLDEAVQAFECGYYNVAPEKPDEKCFVYVTFKNTVIIYHDISLKDMICKKFEPDIDNLSKLFIANGDTREEALQKVENMDRKTKKQLVEYLLYSVK